MFVKKRKSCKVWRPEEEGEVAVNGFAERELRMKEEGRRRRQNEEEQTRDLHG